MNTREPEAVRIKQDWDENPRWKGVTRSYSAGDVVRLRGSVQIEHTLARRGAEKLWKMCTERPYVSSPGALTGSQAMQQMKAGVPAIYLSGWQVAADPRTPRGRESAGLAGPGIFGQLLTEIAAAEPLCVVVEPHFQVRVQRRTLSAGALPVHDTSEIQPRRTIIGGRRTLAYESDSHDDGEERSIGSGLVP